MGRTMDSESILENFLFLFMLSVGTTNLKIVSEAIRRLGGFQWHIITLAEKLTGSFATEPPTQGKGQEIDPKRVQKIRQ